MHKKRRKIIEDDAISVGHQTDGNLEKLQSKTSQLVSQGFRKCRCWIAYVLMSRKSCDIISKTSADQNLQPLISVRTLRDDKFTRESRPNRWPAGLSLERKLPLRSPSDRNRFFIPICRNGLFLAGQIIRVNRAGDK